MSVVLLAEYTDGAVRTRLGRGLQARLSLPRTAWLQKLCEGLCLKGSDAACELCGLVKLVPCRVLQGGASSSEEELLLQLYYGFHHAYSATAQAVYQSAEGAWIRH